MAQQTIRFQCPACGSHLTVPANLAGVRGPCPHCRQEITAPTADVAAASPAPKDPAVGAGAGREAAPSASSKAQKLPRKTFPSRPAEQTPAGASERSSAAAGADRLPPAKIPAKKESFAPPKAAPVVQQPSETSESIDPPVSTRRRNVPANRKASRVPLIAGAVVVLVAVAAFAAVQFLGTRLRKGTGGDEAGGDLAVQAPPSPGGSTTPAADTTPPAPPAPAAEEGTASEDGQPTLATGSAPSGESADPPTLGTGESGEPATVEAAAEAPASPPPLPGDSAPADPVDPAVAAVDDGVLAAPRNTLMAFLDAKDWKERSKFVQTPKSTIPQMERYYASAEDGPVKATSITFQNSEKVPNKPFTFYLFHVATESVPEGFPVSVEETEDGLKVDWQAFVEFGDQLLYKFLTNFRQKSETFHVILRRAHYFGSDIPDLEKKHAFRIEPPIPGYHGYAFVAKDSPLVREKLEPYMDWSAVSYPIVELQWVETESGQRYVRLVDLVQGNWRADAAATAPNPPAE